MEKWLKVEGGNRCNLIGSIIWYWILIYIIDNFFCDKRRTKSKLDETRYKRFSTWPCFTYRIFSFPLLFVILINAIAISNYTTLIPWLFLSKVLFSTWLFFCCTRIRVAGGTKSRSKISAAIWNFLAFFNWKK